MQNVSQKWYNILSLHFIEPQDETPKSIPKLSSFQNTEDVDISKDKTDDMGKPQTGVKEESSDDSTIISSQTSTLTRNQGCDSFQPKFTVNYEELVSSLGNTEDFGSDDSEDDEDDDDGEGITVEFRPNDKLEVVLEDCDCVEKFMDKQTNTECAFYPEHAKQMKLNASGTNVEDRGLIKRSQTFSPAVSKNHYICKLNRSDSDSAMPLYRKSNNPFQRNAVERRSLRFRKQSSSLAILTSTKSYKSLPTTARTSLDLELDLQAQHTRLHMLNTELTRLRDLKDKLEAAKEQGDAELAAWVLEDQQFQNLIAQAENEKLLKTPEEKKIEKMLRKVSREIYKLRKTKAGNGKPDLISFK